MDMNSNYKENESNKSQVIKSSKQDVKKELFELTKSI